MIEESARVQFLENVTSSAQTVEPGGHADARTDQQRGAQVKRLDARFERRRQVHTENTSHDGADRGGKARDGEHELDFAHLETSSR